MHCTSVASPVLPKEPAYQLPDQPASPATGKGPTRSILPTTSDAVTSHRLRSSISTRQKVMGVIYTPGNAWCFLLSKMVYLHCMDYGTARSPSGSLHIRNQVSHPSLFVYNKPTPRIYYTPASPQGKLFPHYRYLTSPSFLW